MSARLATLTSNDPTTNSDAKNDAPSWSHRLGERFCCQIEPTLADWLDSEVWKESGAGEFHHAVSPDSLLADHSDVIWPGLMLPDTLPLIGNRYGDWLCLRVGPDDTVSEIIHWYHGGGDWIPWGRTLAEAITFDSLRDQLPGRRQKHAVDAESRAVDREDNPYLAWALQFAPGLASDRKVGQQSEFVPAISLEWALRHRWCHVALQCELALNALDSPLRQRMTPELAGELGVDWEPEVVSWLFDCRLVPQDVSEVLMLRGHLGAAASRDLQSTQRWQDVQQHALAIASERDDLVWAFDLAGWAEERRGNFQLAAEHYQRGSMALAFADQSIRLRTHWFPQSVGKFSTWRLTQMLDNGLIDQAMLNPGVVSQLNSIRAQGDDSLRVRAMRYWRSVAEAAVEAGRWAEAYDAFYRAGWDLGTDTMIDFGDLLKGLAESAKRAGQRSRSAVAEFHHEAFVSRFG